jgi:hypothetical protein
MGNDTTMKNTDPVLSEANDGARRLKQVEERLAALEAVLELDLEHGRQFIEHRLGRPPTADEINQMARGVKLSAIKSTAAAGAN